MRVYVTGSVAVVGDGVVVRERDLPGAQGRTVLAMLAVEHRRPVARDELADELWPERLPPSWETALRAVVSKVRAALPLEIENRFGCYRLRLPANAWLDSDAAYNALVHAEATLSAADALVASLILRRPLLPGHDGPWAAAERRRLAGLRVRAEECLAESFAAAGDHARSVRAAEHALALDPYRERLHRLVILGYGHAGDRAAAARAFQRCGELFRRDLGIDPAPSTVAALQSVAELRA